MFKCVFVYVFISLKDRFPKCRLFCFCNLILIQQEMDESKKRSPRINLSPNNTLFYLVKSALFTIFVLTPLSLNSLLMLLLKIDLFYEANLCSKITSRSHSLWLITTYEFTFQKFSEDGKSHRMKVSLSQ